MSTHLPETSFARRADLAALVEALGPEEMRWVGGAVRDSLLGLAVKDVDAATTLTPEEMARALEQAGIRFVPTGLAHGTLTALLANGPVEVTTLRRDVATDGRRATIAFTKDWAEDAARRDFTINALYAHPLTLAIEDHVGGLADLAERKVRFIGDARQRILEDHLRILRYFRFQARFGAVPDAAAEAASAELAPTLKGLSRERVAMELLALLALPDPHPTLERMAQLGVLAQVLPEAGPDGLAALARLLEAERAAQADPAPLRRLAALLPRDPRLADQVAARLRLSTAQRKHLVLLAGGIAPGMGTRALAYRHGMEAARDLVLLEGGRLDDLEGWQIPQLPLKGGEIVAAGIAAGPQVARLLQAVERRWIAEDFPPAERVQQLLAEEMARQAPFAGGLASQVRHSSSTAALSRQPRPTRP